MRRIVLIVVLVAVVGFAAFMLFRGPGKKTTAGRKRATAADSASGQTASTPVKTGRTAGRLKAQTKEERKAERKRLRTERRRQKREMRRRERERKRMLRYARRRGGQRKTSRKGQYYVLKATILAPGGERFALIDGRRVAVGEVVMGRRIVAVNENSVEIEAFGRLTVVRIGESLVPASVTTTRRSRRG